MKRYLVFFGSNYYPSGGMGDFVGDFDNVEECKKALDFKVIEDYSPEIHGNADDYVIKRWQSYNWGQIYDTEKKEIVFE